MSTADDNPYLYTPSLVMAVVFIAIFSLSTLAHIIQTFKTPRQRWMWLMAAGGILEVVGWCGRIWSREDIEGGGFTMQISLLIIGPTFFSAALYMLLGVVIQQVAPSIGSIRPKLFKILFIAADIISLVLQGAGGGLASSADTPSGTAMGGNIMLGGIAFQLFVMVLYVAFALWWILHAHAELRRKVVGRNMHLLLFGMGVCSVMIIIRGVYRTIELAQGFHGSLAANQMTFLLDAIPISVAIISLK